LCRPQTKQDQADENGRDEAEPLKAGKRQQVQAGRFLVASRCHRRMIMHVPVMVMPFMRMHMPRLKMLMPVMRAMGRVMGMRMLVRGGVRL